MRSHRAVAETWFAGDKAKGHHMYTDGKTCWSYGSHFPISTWLSGNRILLNTDRYSSSTTQHQCLVRRAIQTGYQVIECNTSEIIHHLDNPDEPVVIIREQAPEDLNSILQLLRDYCKAKGVARFPFEKLKRQIEAMILVNNL